MYINICFLKDHCCSFFLLCISFLFLVFQRTLYLFTVTSPFLLSISVFSVSIPSFTESNPTHWCPSCCLHLLRKEKDAGAFKELTERSSLFWSSYYLYIYTKMDFVICINLCALSFSNCNLIKVVVSWIPVDALC